MRRAVAALLVASMTLQAAGCAKTFSSQPGLTASADRSYAASAAGGPDVRRIPEAGALAAAPPEIPTNEFAGHPYAGMIVGVAVLGALALALALGGKTSESPTGAPP